MRFAVLCLLLTAAVCGGAQEPAAPAPAKEPPKEAPQGLPPRVAPGEYQFQAKAGAVTLAAEFAGHSVPTADGTFSTEDYVVVELGLFGPPEARMRISLSDFTLRVNDKKNILRAQPYGLVLSNLKDPEWVPPESADKKSKTSLGGGGQSDPGSPPPVPKMPMELQHVMHQKTQKAALPLGDRVLPQAGLLFFQYRGQAKGIKSIELYYSGSAGKVTMKLQP